MAYVIKRYANRKLYDPHTSRYVTLDEIAAMIRAGQEIAVVDAASGDDLTAVVLAQIILETAKHQGAVLPTTFLHQLIQYGAAWQDFALDSLKASLQGVLTSQRQADRILRQWAERCGWWQPPHDQETTETAAASSAELEALKRDLTRLQEHLQTVTERLDRQHTVPPRDASSS